ncbi:fruit-specific protein [Nicotiana tabacum]|uniref:fruit-specific protein n=1 Tax=Nicotiana tabacum TaxID=4097 RepID=UPI003F4E6735
MASFKQAFLLIALFVAITVNLSGSPKMQVMALRDLPEDVAMMKDKLLPLGDIVTCLKYCNVESDCSDGWLCYNCVPSAFQGWRSQCDKLTATGEGYFGTILRAKHNKI